jgi:hypothetical protein
VGLESGCRSGAGERDGGEGVDQFGGDLGRQRRARRHARRRREDRRVGGEFGDGAPPGGHALAGEHGETERERLAASVQCGVAELLVAGVQPGTGSGGLAGVRGEARISSGTAR